MPPAVGLNVTSAVPGQPLLASGSVPDTSVSYELCLLVNATWTIGAPFTGPCILEQPLTTATNAFAGVPLGPAPGPGTYDLLLIGPAASGAVTALAPASGTIVAVADASAAPGLVVGGVAEIPVGGRAGLFGFALLVAAAAFVLLRQFR